jgi:hypothetical protein
VIGVLEDLTGRRKLEPRVAAVAPGAEFREVRISAIEGAIGSGAKALNIRPPQCRPSDVCAVASG